jgi:hypothetical protein
MENRRLDRMDVQHVISLWDAFSFGRMRTLPASTAGLFCAIQSGAGRRKDSVVAFRAICCRDAGQARQRPEKFEFLGFKHVCEEDRGARFALIRTPTLDASE